MTTSTSDHTANLGRETAAMHAYIIESVRAAEHPKGHTKKVLRYRTPCGIDVAVMKSLGAPSLYVARVVAEGRINHLSPEFMPAGRTGRNSNLNAMETFRDRALAKLKITTPEIGRAAFDACVTR
jgi:hypothetical protein